MQKNYKPILTIALIAINVLVFLLELSRGDSMDPNVAIDLGASFTPYILENGEWYRLFNSMFIHFGIEHLGSNMIALIAIGQYVEWYFGRVKFLIIYILSGLVGNLLSMGVELFFTHNYFVSAGASGAISGLFGAMIILAIDPETKKIFSLPRAIIAMILLIVPGIGNTGIDVMSHIGGIIGGFITAYIFYLFRKKHPSSDHPSDNSSDYEDDYIIDETE